MSLYDRGLQISLALLVHMPMIGMMVQIERRKA